MKHNKLDSVFLGISIGGFLLQAVSFLLMPVETLQILPGLLFWGGLVIGAVFQIVLETRRRALFAKYHVRRQTMQKPRNGLLSFGSNRFATVADITLAISLVTTVLAFVFTKGTGYMCYGCLSILQVSFYLHCILNGRNYFYIKNKTKIQQVLEQRKANSNDKGEGKNEKR